MTITGRRILYLLFILLLPSTLLPQSIENKDYIRLVQEADQFFYFAEDYESAAQAFKRLLDQYPDNCNLKAKLGICYLNVDGKSLEALRLLQEATANVVTSDNSYLEYGKVAPLDTWFYLAHAYHINDSLEKAITMYRIARNKISSSEAFRSEYIDNQICACQFAMEEEKNKTKTSSTLFTEWLKDYPGATNPVVSANDSVFLFTVRDNNTNHIYCSYRKKEWQKPEDISSELQGFDRLWTNSVTSDGSFLVLYMDDGADGNLYYSKRTGTKWSRVRKFGKTINTKYWEAHGFITPDGTRLYFSSNRDDGEGELDIWYADLLDDGSWSKAVNLGKRINTQYNENTPFFSPSGNILLFASEGHKVMGGYDIFMSTYLNGTWSEPIGLPPPYNSTSNNSFFLLASNGKGYITSLVDPSTGIRNIYDLQPDEKKDETVTASGSIDLQDGMTVIPSFVNIEVRKSDSTKWEKLPVLDNGNFSFAALKGNYKLHISYRGYKTDTINLSIPETYTGTKLSLSSTLVPDKVSKGDFLAIRSLLFDYNSYTLTERSVQDLAKISAVLGKFPGLKIEVTGYTDDRGDASYNLKLAAMRADAVIKYLTGHGIDSSRFFSKAAGASGFVALNSNPDGSDNPEGRQLNRRVTLGIINPQTGISIRMESFTPKGLRHPYSKKYSIVLLKSKEKFFPDYFADFSMNELLFVRPVLKDSLYFYVLGEFSDMPDAEKYLDYARKKGFNEGYITDQYDLAGESRQLGANPGHMNIRKEPGVYTIQVRASVKQIKLSEFNGLNGIKEVKGKDVYYRYIYGEYEGFSKAREALDQVHRAGYHEAFIKEFTLLLSQ